jgi:hypothetical protein
VASASGKKKGSTARSNIRNEFGDINKSYDYTQVNVCPLS